MRTIACGLFILIASGCGSSGGDDAAKGAMAGSSGTGSETTTSGSTAAGGTAVTGGNVGPAGNAGATGSTGTSGGTGTGGSAGTKGSSGAGGNAGMGGTKGTGGSTGVGGGSTAIDGGPASGEQGIWQNVTPAGINLDVNYPYSAANFGVQDVLADPVRPADFYAFTCYNGVWKSTDYGLSWSKVSTGTNGATLDQGRMWTAAIDSNKMRNPSTPPALFTVDGYGSKPGLYKSTDGGVNWAYIDVSATGLGNDVYALDVDPYDGQHMLMGFHGPGVAESVDGGATWTNRTGSVAGSSIYPFFVDTGSAPVTRKTWVTVPQWGNNTDGMWLTTSGGSAWSRVNDIEHVHGCSQVCNAGGGVLYAAGMSVNPGTGVFRSMDAGATWSKVDDSKENGVFATKNHLYASYGWATGAAMYNDGAPRLSVAAATGSGWVSVNAPTGMWNGAKRAATSFDGTHYVIVSGNWGAGLWRYIEP
jgi:hypothetical protein